MKLPEIQDFLFKLSTGYQKEEIEGFWLDDDEEIDYDIYFRYTVVLSYQWALDRLRRFLKDLNKDYLKEDCIYFEISSIKMELL